MGGIVATTPATDIVGSTLIEIIEAAGWKAVKDKLQFVVLAKEGESIRITIRRDLIYPRKKAGRHLDKAGITPERYEQIRASR